LIGKNPTKLYNVVIIGSDNAREINMPFLPFIPFLDCADLVIHFTEQSVQWLLTFGFKYSGAVGVPELNALLGAVDSWITSDLAGQIGTTDTIDFIRATGLTTAVDPSITLTPATTAGTLAGNVLSAQAAMVTTFVTALRGRSYRGRQFLGGRVHGDLLTTSAWTAARQAAVHTMYTNLPAAVGAVGWTHVILSRQLNNVRRVVGVSTPVVDYLTKVAIATQRKRLI
jgi:hypothetical protein